MQITLNQEEIELALDAFVRSRINVADSQTIVFDLKAGRGDNGMTATLDIVPADIAANEPVAFRPKAVEGKAAPQKAEKGSPEKESAPESSEDEDVPMAETDTTSDSDASEEPPKGRSLFSKSGS